MPEPTTFLAEGGFVDDRWVAGVRYDVDEHGTIVRAGARTELPSPPALRIRDFGRAMVLPGMVDVHSHAFQRAIRGATQRRAVNDPTSFWSWRSAMYDAAMRLTPDEVYAITRLAFAEMLRAGITCVGEFHYLHHRPDGVPYDDPNELGWQIVRAAEDTGIRLVLLDVFYARAGAGRPALPEQRRFCDRDADSYLARVDALRSRGVTVGIAPHSVRAVGRDDLRTLVDYARKHDLPLQMHVSEQPRENDECLAEHGCTPMELVAEIGGLARPRSFTAVHAVHTSDRDRDLLADQSVCACPTTEADLGDGILGAGPLAARGCNLALGSDSNAVIDLVQEARLLEMGERLRTGTRLCLRTAERDVANVLVDIAANGGALALGRSELGRLTVGRQFDAAIVGLGHPFFAGIDPERAADAMFTSGTAQPVEHVVIGGHERA
ncbi:MAG TPA: formimidoylglutamate deiminase [Nannocystaceae bacterium]|nr:formimidoylglutamate deiminase [Nannocystaceae bacterium]